MRTAHSPSTRKGQTWSIDYTIGMLLFLFGILVAVKLLINSSQSTGFGGVEQASQSTSDLLVGEGVPSDWTNDTVAMIGLTTKNNLNITKLKRLYAMDPTRARRYLNTKYDFYLFIEDKDRGILYLNTTCGYGSEDVRAVGPVQYATVAYYASDAMGAIRMMDLLGTSYNASVYIRDALPGTVVNGFTVNGSLTGLLLDLDRYDTLFLENASFDKYSGGMNATAVAAAISEWVSRGNVLVMVQGVGVDVAGGAFPTTPQGAGNLTVQAEHPDSAFVLGDSFIPDAKYTVGTTSGMADFVKLANYSSGDIGLAIWKYGEGTIFYMSDTQGLLGAETNVTARLNYTLARLAPGFCAGLDLSGLNAENLVAADRYVVHNERITKMRLYMWDHD